jgi:predicted outer membrane protein
MQTSLCFPQSRLGLIVGVLLAFRCLEAVTALGNEPKNQPAPGKTTPPQTTQTAVPQVNPPTPVLKIPGRTGPEEQFIQSAILDLHRATEISKLASERGQDAEIKQLAGSVTVDLSVMTQDLVSLAQRKGVENPLEEPKPIDASPEGPSTRRELSPFSKVPQTKPVDEPEKPSAAQDQVAKPSPDPVSRDLVQKLQGLYGDAFDRRYLQELARNHGKATQNCEQASRYLADEDLKKFSMSALPKLQEQRQRITELAQRKNIDLGSQEQALR